MPGSRRTDPALLQRITAARVLELTPDIAVVTDHEGALVYGNSVLEQRIGRPLDTLVGRSVGELIHPEDRPSWVQGWRELVEGTRDELELAVRFGSTSTGCRWSLGSVSIDREAGLLISTHRETTALRDAE